MSLPFEARALEELRKEIVKDLERLHEELGAGTLIVWTDAAASSLKYAHHAGQIKYAKHVIDNLYKHVIERMSGKPDRKKD